MNTYKVPCWYRNDDGLNYSRATHRDTVTVKARDIYDARREAIDAMYAKHGNVISHVQPGTPVEA